MNKRFISAVLSAAVLFCAAYIPAAAKGDKVTLIVETDGAPLLETKKAARSGAVEYMKTDEAKEYEMRLLSAQANVKSAVEKRVNADADGGFTYTSVFNGFSMDAYETDIEKIKKTDGVKNVYISEAHELPTEPVSDGESEPGYGAQMMNAQAMYDAGFDGRGQAVAILDTEFDVGHEFISAPVENPRLSKDYIKDFIKNNKLNINVSANQVYKSSKVPFAYDYSANDADTYSTADEHGMHVAGIAAGKNGVFEGTTFSGAAPEAQLVLMKICDDEGIFYDSAILAALDDVSKMDVCAVNMSFGGICAEDPLYEKAVNNLTNAGIAAICAIGNSDRYAETAENPDYSYKASPACSSNATAVASIDADKKWVIGGTLLLGGEELSISVYEEAFMDKFADKPCEYVYGDTLAEFESVDISGKIGIAPSGGEVKSGKLLEMGAIGAIFISGNESDERVSTASDEIPGIMVRKSYGEKFKNAETKTIQTVNERIIYNETNADAGMSDFTNWGTYADLELKPEITAPGGKIFSSLNDDTYDNKNGTSMAAPQITGAMALMSGFADARFPDITGSDKIALMENILMSSADIVYQNEEKTLPESPRRQGAGLANLADALKIPVILKGDTGKSKLSLGDNLNDNISLTFTAENLTDKAVTYDDITIYAFTDHYEEQDGKNMITDSVPLKFTSDKPESVTIPAGGEKKITVNLTLDSAQTAANKKIFTNGFWVDGYVILSSKDGSVTKASIPYTGFYGDWTAFDAMTPLYFEEGGSEENGGLMLNLANGPTMLGTNIFADDDAPDRNEYESEDYVGFSGLFANCYYLHIRMLRSLKDVSVTVKDSSGNIISKNPYDHGLARQDSNNGYMSKVPIDTEDLPDGDYYVTVSGRLAYDSERSRTEEKTCKFYIDSESPEISDPKIYEENGRKYASFEANDNRCLMGAGAWDASGKETYVPVKAEKRAQITLDITDLDESTLEFIVCDYAYNERDFKIGELDAEIVRGIKEGGSAAFAVSVANTAGDVDADIIMALYDADGALVGVKTQREPIESGSEKAFSFTFNGAANASSAKLFVWEHGKAEPLCEPADISDL